MDLFVAYVFCFAVGLVYAIASALAGHLFGGHEHPGDVGTGGHSEAGLGGDHMPSIGPLSPTTLAAFVTAFGGIGMVLATTESLRHPILSLPLSLLGGFAIAAAVLALFRTVFARTQSSSESRVFQLPGRQATVITPIEPGRVGEIAYVDRGTRYTAAARAEVDTPVPAGSTVTISRVVGSQFYVRAAASPPPSDPPGNPSPPAP